MQHKIDLVLKGKINMGVRINLLKHKIGLISDNFFHIICTFEILDSAQPNLVMNYAANADGISYK